MNEANVPGAQDTIYLCNFRVSVEGEWLCLKELDDVDYNNIDNFPEPRTPSPIEPLFIGTNFLFLGSISGLIVGPLEFSINRIQTISL